ncbi:MAG: c-type cytochrome [Burkholderiales bacterium]|nr:c-type cytochrome [Burkholderiales bacterium]
MIGACPALAAPAASAARGDAALGQRIATRGLADTAATACIGCHGAHGEGNAAAGFPRLNRQAAGYLQRQLAAYADGSRVNAVMQPIAQALNRSQQAAVAGYFAGLPLAAVAQAAAASPATPTASAPSAASGVGSAGRGAGARAAGVAGSGSARGRLLAEVGDERLGVQACANCHGPGGNGRGELAPALAGQHAGYLLAALQEWAKGSRRTDASGQMPQIAARLSAEDQQAVSDYFGSLMLAALPSASLSTSLATTLSTTPARSRSPSAARPRHAAVPSGPRPTAGAGKASAPTGQGAAQPGTLTGGSQGPGGGGGGTGSGAGGGTGGTPTGR